MILWLNGPFGVGKTQTAYALHHRLPGSFVCDPEHLGFALHRMTPRAVRGDFQDLPLWREGTWRTLATVQAAWPGPIIVPMTVVVPQYHQELVEGLRRAGLEVHHFTLLASRATLQRRLCGRGEGRSSYGARQLERCLKALVQPVFAEHLITDGRGIDEVAEALAARAGLVLQPRASGLFKTALRRWRVQWAHRRRD